MHTLNEKHIDSSKWTITASKSWHHAEANTQAANYTGLNILRVISVQNSFIRMKWTGHNSVEKDVILRSPVTFYSAKISVAEQLFNHGEIQGTKY